jgi:hypothetical protein
VRRRGLIVGVGALALAAGLVAWVAWSGGSAASRSDLAVTNPVHNSAGIDMPNVRIGDPWVYNLGYPICTTGEPLTVTGVQPNQPSGDLRIVDWSLGAPANTLGMPGTAAQTVGLHHPSVTWSCRSREGYRRGMLTVSVALHSSKAVAHGFLVRSTAGSVVVPFVVAECVASSCNHTSG